MEACSVHQSAIYALRDFLQAQFNADERFGEQPSPTCVVVRGEWPGPGDNLPPRAISIIPAGERRDDHLTEEVVKVTIKPNNQGEYTWSVKAFTQPFQLDIWANYDAHRDELENALDRFLNMGPLYTLGFGDITRDGPLLKLDPVSGHEGFLDFMFEGPRQINEETANGQYQYRTIIRGEVAGELTFTATTAKLVRVKLQQLLDGYPNNFTLTKSGEVFALTPDT